MKRAVIDFLIQAVSDMGYPVDLTEDSSLVNDAGLDSLDIVDLSAMIEEEYNISISDAEYGVFKETVADVADLITSKLCI